MKLTWHGHACFRIVANDGLVLVTDPYDPETSGYRPLRAPAHVVVRSSPTDSFHCNAHLVPGDPTLVEALELARRGAERTVGGVTFRAVPAEEGKAGVRVQDANAIYRFDVDGMSIGHMGDAGQPLTAEQLAFLDGVDVLLALAGGPPTIPLDALRDAIDAIAPKLVVPMHFRTLRLKLAGPIAWPSAFLEALDGIPTEFACDDTIELGPGDLPRKTQMRVLAYT